MRLRSRAAMPYSQKLRQRQQYVVVSLIVLSGLISSSVFLAEFRARAATTFVLTNVNDNGPGSLRQAIIDANSNPGLDTISFHIASGPQTIKPLEALPFLTDPVVIDGATQPGFSGAPIIELDGFLNSAYS